jgi:DNA-binding PadR family transcriptional regulator
MSKRKVLEIFAANPRFMRPDEIRACLQNHSQRSSVYSYLSRLCRQGLLERAQGWARVAYRITPRGMERLRFFRLQQRGIAR